MNKSTRNKTPLDPAGEGVSRYLFGDDFIERSIKKQTAFDGEWLEFVTNQVFGRTWARGILEHRQLSLVNLAMLAGLGRMEEFELHFRLALNRTKVPLIQLREILMHITLYCGVPMGRDCFAIARRVLKEENVDLSGLEDEGEGDHGV